MSTSEDQPTAIELIELSDLAWTIIDSDGEHESLERTWTEALPRDWAPAEGVGELRARLSQITDRVRGADDQALLQVVSTVIVYLAARPDRRRVDQAVIGEAVREEYGQEVPEKIAAWLARPTLAAHLRPHGAEAPRRHFHSRPPAPPGDG